MDVPLIGEALSLFGREPWRAGVFVAGWVFIIAALWPIMSGKGRGGEGGGTVMASGRDTIIMNQPTFQGPAQIGGQGNTLNVNQPAYFADQATFTRSQVGNVHHLRLSVPVVPGGIWQPGTEMAFGFKLSGPARRWQVDPENTAFGGTMMNVTVGPQENTDVIVFKTTTAPRPGVPIVFDVESDAPLTAVGNWHPTKPQ